MTKRKSGSMKKTVTEACKIQSIREQKIMNAVTNTTIILMGTLMGSFSEVMVGMTDAMASGMAEAFGGKEAGEQVKSEMANATPKVNEEMKKIVSEMRKDMYKQMEQKRKEIEPLLSDKAFDKGPMLIEASEFGIPKLTEELDDDALAQYSYLLVSEDEKFAKLFSGLTEWLQSLPSPPENKKKQK